MSNKEDKKLNKKQTEAELNRILTKNLNIALDLEAAQAPGEIDRQIKLLDASNEDLSRILVAGNGTGDS